MLYTPDRTYGLCGKEGVQQEGKDLRRARSISSKTAISAWMRHLLTLEERVVADGAIICGLEGLLGYAVKLCTWFRMIITSTDIARGLMSSPSRNSCPTPCTSLGGISASPINCCLICSKRSLPLSSSRLRMPNASASMRNGAATLTGVGTALLLETLDVSICSRAEKKVERSGRRGGWFWEVSDCWLEMLCSTDATSVANFCLQEDLSPTFVACHLVEATADRQKIELLATAS